LENTIAVFGTVYGGALRIGKHLFRKALLDANIFAKRFLKTDSARELELAGRSLSVAVFM
jgi:hypothetical protein